MSAEMQSLGLRSDVVLARDVAAVDTGAARLAAIAELAHVARAVHAPLILQLDPASETVFAQIVEMLGREGARVVPVVALDVAGARDSRGTFDPVPMLRTLATARLLAEWNNERFVGVRVGSEKFPAADAEALAAALTSAGARARVGFVRVRTGLTPIPDGFDCAFDWLPYAPMTETGTATASVVSDYSLVATEIARRHAGLSPLAPNVPFSTAAEFDLPQSAARLTGVSPIKIAYAIDVAHRFVHNRAGSGVPFWVLRIDPVAGPGTADAVRAALEDSNALRYASSAGMWKGYPAQSDARIAVVLHLYYPELWDEFAAAIEAIGEPCDVYVSCPLRARGAVSRLVCARFPTAQVAGVHNVGRDVLPFLAWLAAPGIDRYAYVLKLHSKKSMHIVDERMTPAGGGEAWRRRSLNGLLPDRQRTRNLLDALDARRDIGIVAPAGLLYDQIQWRCATGDLMATLCRRIGLSGTVSGGFPAGTMFWARVAALAPLMRLPAAALEFEREAAQTDGTLHHTYERVFSLVAAAGGYRSIDSAALIA